jgi:hypothetical protein
MTYATHKTPLAACPFCGRGNDRSTSIEAHLAPPSAGDASICFKCGAVSVYVADLSLRRPTVDEMGEFMGVPDVVRAMQAWRMLNGGRGA